MIHQEETIAILKAILIPSLRESDVWGWYHNYHTIGIIFTEVLVGKDTFVDLIVHKIYDRICKRINPDWINKIDISFHLFPEAGGNSFKDFSFNDNLYPDLTKRSSDKNISVAVKKIIDVLGEWDGAVFFCTPFSHYCCSYQSHFPGTRIFQIGKSRSQR